MVVRFTSVLLLVLPSFIYGNTTTIKVFDDSGSLELSSFPDEVTISDSLNVTVSISGGVPLSKGLPLNIKVLNNLLTPVYTDEKVTIIGDGRLGKSVIVTFRSSSQVPLQQQPIPVTVSTTLDGTPVVVKSQIIDNRVGIGFLRESEQIRPCHPKEDCDLAVEINHSLDSFNITIDLLDSNGKSVDWTTLSVERDGVHYLNVTPPELGRYTAVLSVADQSIESRVYWSQRITRINVVASFTELESEVRNLTKSTQILWQMYRHLSEEYYNLTSQVERLLTALPVVDHSCDKVNCSGHGVCVRGRCNCTYPYEGNACDKYIPCQSEPCGSRGSCKEPGDIAEIDYVCQCFNGSVIGLNCTDCVKGYCSEPHGGCSVDEETGVPKCSCLKGFKGNHCENCSVTPGPDPCGKNRVCNSSTSRCECRAGYVGENCHEMCLDDPCGSHGNCSTKTDAPYYNCTCNPGYSGRDCDTHVCNDLKPCQNGETCEPDSNSKGYKCTSPPTTTESSDGDNVPNPVYQQPAVWAIAIFIVVLVICVLAYIGYHNRNKILELFGRRKESVIEMAMRSRTKSKGYKKLPTSIHDTLTHED